MPQEASHAKMQDTESISSTTTTLQNIASPDEFLKIAATETVLLFEHFELEFLCECDMLVLYKRGQTRVHKPPELFRGLLHCYYENVCGTRSITRELQDPLVQYCHGLDRPPSRDAVDRSFTDLEHVVDEAFGRLVEQATLRGLLDSAYRIDSTYVEAIQWNDEASQDHDSMAEEHYYGLGYTIAPAGVRIPTAAKFIQVKQASEEMAMRITRDAFAVDTPIWIIGDSTYDALQWHDSLLGAGVVPIAPYNPRNTDEPLDTGYRVKDQIEEHSEGLQLKQSVLEETYNCRIQVERTNDMIKDCGFGRVRARGHVRA